MKKILIIEEDMQVVPKLIKMFKNNEDKTFIVEDVNKGFKMLGGERFDTIIIEEDMLKDLYYNHFQIFCSEIRKRPKKYGNPYIMVIGNNLDIHEVEEQIYISGMSEYIPLKNKKYFSGS